MKPKPITILGTMSPFCPDKIRGMDIAGYEPEPEKKNPETPKQPEPDDEDE